nr:hypothetical protein CFP56_72382 [Quercus suber]
MQPSRDRLYPAAHGRACAELRPESSFPWNSGMLRSDAGSQLKKHTVHVSSTREACLLRLVPSCAAPFLCYYKRRQRRDE